MKNPHNSVMIITFDMVPYALWGACQRMYYLADYLQDHGFSVSVVHAKKPEYTGNFGHAVRFRSIPVPISLSGQPSEGISTDKMQNGKAVNAQKNLLSSIKISGKKIILYLEKLIFNEPNKSMGIYGYIFSRNARDEVFRALSENTIDHVIISGPPFSIFNLGPQIKKRFPGINLILDYRDPWNTPRLSYRIPSFMEKQALRAADKVVFTNDNLLDDISQKYNVPKEKCEVVMNGYSRQDWDEIFKESAGHEIKNGVSDRMILSYIGDFSLNKGGFRDITSFFEAFKLFQKNKKILLRFVGVKPSEEIDTIKKQFPETLEILHPVDTKKALLYMLKSDVLCLNHTDENTGRYVSPGKMYDYMRSGNVIWGIADSDDTSFFRLIYQYHLGITCLSGTSDILKNFELLYDTWIQGSLGELRTDKGLIIDTFSRDTQNSKYMNLLERI
jgi:glycosyltransferase involved in cell wall biosynthesis